VISYQLDDMVQGVKNFIEAAEIQEDDKVSFLADTPLEHVEAKRWDRPGHQST